MVEAIVFTNAKRAVDVAIKATHDNILDSAFPPRRRQSHIRIGVQQKRTPVSMAPECSPPIGAVGVAENGDHVGLKAIQRITHHRVVSFPEAHMLGTACNRKKFVSISFQQRNIPYHFYVKSWIDVFRHPPVAAKKDLRIHLRDFGHLPIPGSEVLDRMADDGG